MAVTVEASADSTAIRPFTFEVPEADLEDLRARILATRWPDKETVTDDSQGVPLATMQELARHWATDYDWRRCEAMLNELPNFITEIDGLDIHFIHVRSRHEDALPLIVTHGWPGSIIEQLKIIEPLTNPTAHGARRLRRIPSRDSFAAGTRVLRQADHHRMGSRPHRTGLGGADEAPRIRTVRGAGRRLGRGRHPDDGRPGAAGAARHSLQHARHGSGRHQQGGPARRPAAAGDLSPRRRAPTSS